MQDRRTNEAILSVSGQEVFIFLLFISFWWVPSQLRFSRFKVWALMVLALSSVRTRRPDCLHIQTPPEGPALGVGTGNHSSRLILSPRPNSLFLPCEQIAMKELRERKIPFTIRRYLPDGR